MTRLTRSPARPVRLSARGLRQPVAIASGAGFKGVTLVSVRFHVLQLGTYEPTVGLGGDHC